MQAGDALFLPEGWWHQIDSEGSTIAVNFWWRSPFDRLLGTHMDAYYLRRIARSLTEARKADLLQQLSPESGARTLQKAQPHGEPGQSAGKEGAESRAADASSEAGKQSLGSGSKRKKRVKDTATDGDSDRFMAEQLATTFSAELEAAADDLNDNPGQPQTQHISPGP